MMQWSSSVAARTSYGDEVLRKAITSGSLLLFGSSVTGLLFQKWPTLGKQNLRKVKSQRSLDIKSHRPNCSISLS